MLLCASPQLLRTSPKVVEPDDLLRLPWVGITQLPHPEKLHLEHVKSAQRLVLSVHPTVKTHSGIAAREFIRCGAGIGLLPDYAVEADLRSADLVQLLPAWREAYERPISALFPSRDRLPTRVRLLIDFLRQAFLDRVPVDTGRPAPARTRRRPLAK
jgi:DNA-binding transcriptional LysR family regulator